MLARLANLFVVGFALDGGLSLAEEIVRATTGSALLLLPRNLLAQAVLLAALPCFLALVLTPRLPVSIFLPLVATVVWLNSGAAPIPLWIESTTALGVTLTSLQLAIAGASLLRIRRATGGEAWLFSESALAGPGFSLRHTLAFGAASMFLLLPAGALYALVAAATWIQLATHGFVVFDLQGVSLGDRHYTRDAREIRLVGMLHVGEEDAYRALVASFAAESTVVLEEGVTDREGTLDVPLSYAQVAANLGLEPQVELGSYLAAASESGEPPPWPHLRHADVDVSEFDPATVALLERVARFWESDDLLTVLARAVNEPITQEQLELFQRDLIARRNQHLLGEIESALADDYQRVVVPWGALHLPGIERAITGDGFELARATRRRLLSWLTVVAALASGPGS